MRHESDYFSTPQFEGKFLKAMRELTEAKLDEDGKRGAYEAYLDRINEVNDQEGRLRTAVTFYSTALKESTLEKVCLRDINLFPAEEVEKEITRQRVRSELRTEFYKTGVLEMLQRPDDDPERKLFERECPQVLARNLCMDGNLARLQVANRERYKL